MRTLYRVTAEGIPKSRDRHFDPDSTLVEDRVVLFQATSFDDAIALGVKEAQAYLQTDEISKHLRPEETDAIHGSL